MAIVTGDQYLDQLADFIDQQGEELLDGRQVLKLNPVGLLYLQSRLGELEELEDLKVNAPVDYLRAFITNLGDNRKLEKLCRVLRVIECLKVVSLTKNVRDPTPINLRLFPRLRILELRGCDLSTSNPRGLLELRPCLEKLLCYDSAAALHHILADRTKELEAALHWPRLTTLSCPENGMQVMDASLMLLPALEVLDLSKNRFAQVANLNNCPRLTYLDLGFNGIKSLGSLNQVLGSVTKVVLRSNVLTSTHGLEKLYRLEGLDLSFNLISSVNEVARLGHLPHLEFLWLQGNPISFLPNFRMQVLKLFDSPEKIALDGKQVEGSERRRFGRAAGRKKGERPPVRTEAETVPLLSDEIQNQVMNGSGLSSSGKKEECATAEAESVPLFPDDTQDKLKNGSALLSQASTTGIDEECAMSASGRGINSQKSARKPRRAARLAEIVTEESRSPLSGKQVAGEDEKYRAGSGEQESTAEQSSTPTASVGVNKHTGKERAGKIASPMLTCLKGDELLEMAEILKKEGGNAWLKAYNDFVGKRMAEEACGTSRLSAATHSSAVMSGEVTEAGEQMIHEKEPQIKVAVEEGTDGFGGSTRKKDVNRDGDGTVPEKMINVGSSVMAESQSLGLSRDKHQVGVTKTAGKVAGLIRNQNSRTEDVAGDVCAGTELLSKDIEEKRACNSGYLVHNASEGSNKESVTPNTHSMSKNKMQWPLAAETVMKTSDEEHVMAVGGENVSGTGMRERSEVGRHMQKMGSHTTEHDTYDARVVVGMEDDTPILQVTSDEDQKLGGTSTRGRRDFGATPDCRRGGRDGAGAESEIGNFIEAASMDMHPCKKGVLPQFRHREGKQIAYGDHSNWMLTGSSSLKCIQKSAASVEIRSADASQTRDGPLPPRGDYRLRTVDMAETSSDSSDVEWTDESEADETAAVGMLHVWYHEGELQGVPRHTKAGRGIGGGQKSGNDAGQCKGMETVESKVGEGDAEQSCNSVPPCVGVKHGYDTLMGVDGGGSRALNAREHSLMQGKSPSRATTSSGAAIQNDRRKKRNHKHAKRIVRLSSIGEDEDGWRRRIDWEVRLSSGAVVTATVPANECVEKSEYAGSLVPISASSNNNTWKGVCGTMADDEKGFKCLPIGLKNDQPPGSFRSGDTQALLSIHGMESLECQLAHDPKVDMSSTDDANNTPMQGTQEVRDDPSCLPLRGTAMENVDSSKGDGDCAGRREGGELVGLEARGEMLQQFVAPVADDAREEDDIRVCFRNNIADRERKEQCMMYWRCGYLRLWGPATKEREVLLLISTEQMLYFLSEEFLQAGHSQASYPILRILASHFVGDLKRVVVGIGLQCLRLEIGVAATYLVVFRSASLTAEFIECISSACKSGHLQPRITLEIASCEREQIEHMERDLFGGKKTSIHFYAMLHCRIGQERLWRPCSLILTSCQIVLCEERLVAFGNGVCKGREFSLQSALSSKKTQQCGASHPASKSETYFTQLCSRSLNEVQRVETYEDRCSNVIRIRFLPMSGDSILHISDNSEGSTSLVMTPRRSRLPLLFSFLPHREEEGVGARRMEVKKSQKQVSSESSRLSSELKKGDTYRIQPGGDEESSSVPHWDLRFSDCNSFEKLLMMVRAA